MSTVFSDHLLTGDHASRPAANAVPQGTLYSCTDHGVIYKSDGVATWSDWATLSGVASEITHILLDGRAHVSHRHQANEANLPGITALIAAGAGSAVDDENNILANQIFGA